MACSSKYRILVFFLVTTTMVICFFDNGSMVTNMYQVIKNQISVPVKVNNTSVDDYILNIQRVPIDDVKSKPILKTYSGIQNVPTPAPLKVNTETILHNVPIVGVKNRRCCTNKLLCGHCSKRNISFDLIPQNCDNFDCFCYKSNPVETPYYTNRNVTSLEMEYIVESEIPLMNDPTVTDIKELPDPKHTRVIIYNGNCTVGDVINVRVDVYNGYNKQLHRGRDDVRGWLFSGKNSIDSSVKDFYNGSYLLSFPTLWAGPATLTIDIHHIREVRALKYKWTRQLVGLFYHYGLFLHNNKRQTTVCHTNHIIPGYQSVCNFTKANNNIPWFCGRPPSPDLKCNHLKYLNTLGYINFPATEIQRRMLEERIYMRLVQGLKVFVSGKPPDPLQLTPCNKLTPKDSWNLKWPLGHYIDGTWTPSHCKIIPNDQAIASFLRNTSIHLFGDSTTRQWYTALQTFSKCNQTTEKWTSRKWYKDSTCVNKNWNFTLDWSPHEMPFSVLSVPNASKFYNYPISNALDTPNLGNHRYIIIIHYYLHISKSFYLNRKIIQKLKEMLAKRPIQPHITILFKGPHAFSDSGCVAGLSDIMTRDYINILHNELKSVSDKIWYLDYWNMLNPMNNRLRHPVPNVIWQMLRMLFGYIYK